MIRWDSLFSPICVPLLALIASEPSVAANKVELQTAAWNAWKSGDASKAMRIGKKLINEPETADEGKHVVVLAAHVLGLYDEAINTFAAIDPRYARLSELRGAVFESHLHLGRAADALQFAEQYKMSENAKWRARSLIDSPIRISLEGVSVTSFERDKLTPFLPGVVGSVNGMKTIFRFDTGGTFVAMSPALATSFGVRSSNCAGGFANLQTTQVCFGVADIVVGQARVENAPVVVVASLPAEQQGVELGPVLGTNFMSHFLSTIDAPRNRIILSRRGDRSANRQHIRLLGSSKRRIPFLLWSDHFILAKGSAGKNNNLIYFVDSGLVSVDSDGTQAGLLLPKSEAAKWSGNADQSPEGSIVTLGSRIGLGSTTQSGQRGLILPDAAWKAFGSFGGIKVNALISYGFLKNWSWTLDFDRRSIILN